MMEKILLVASFEPLSPGAIYLASLRQEGYEPLCFDTREEYQKVFSHTKNPLINSVVKPYVNRILNNRLLSIVSKYRPDTVFVHKDCFVDRETVKEMKGMIRGRLHIFDGSFNPIQSTAESPGIFSS